VTPGPLAAVLETPRLTLEPLRLAHAAACYPAFSEPSLYRYIEMPMPESEPALRRRFADWIKGSGRTGERWANWIAVDKRSKQPAGWFQATVHERHADIAYLVFDAFQRRGMAVEAVQALCDHLFASTPIDEIRAQTDDRNKGSIRVAVGAGFVPDAAGLETTMHGEPSRDLVFRRRRPPPAA
jgi:RimJ/RimL family protein N-acetyltransferase